MFKSRRILVLFVAGILVPAMAFAQPGGGRGPGGPGGPGGFGPPGGFGGGSSLAREVRSESVQGDLQLTDEQKQQLEEMGDGRDQMRDVMAPLFEKMRTAQTEEERQALQAEMQVQMQEFTKANDEKVRALLKPEQQTRLQQIVWQRSGSRAYTQDDVVKELGITPEQKQKIEELQAKYDEARRALGFRGTDEDREKLRAEYEPQIQAVLTADQQSRWKERVGAPAPEEDRGRGRGGPPGGGPGGPPTSQGPTPPRPAFVEAVPEGVQVAGSFGTPLAMNSSAGGPGVGGSATPVPVAGTAVATAPLTFNFSYMPWIDVLKLFAQAADLTLDPQEVPPGTFTYSDPASYTPTEALDVLNGYLIQRGYILVRRDEFLVSLNIDHGIPPNLVPTVLVSELGSRGRNELLTVVFPLAGLDVDLISNEIDQLKGPQGKVVGLKTSKAIMVTDIGANLRRIKVMLETMAAAAGPQDRTFSPYTLQHIIAEEAEAIIRVMLGAQIAAVNVSASNDRRDPRSIPAAASVATIAIDPRTNTLLVTATPIEHTIIKDTLKTIDIDGEAAGFSATSRKPYLVVYKMQGSDAREVTKTIDAMIPGIVVNEDGQNGKIHINATAKQHEEVAALIRQMDGLGGGLMQVAVIPLVKSDPLNVSATLRSVFVGDGTTAPTIEADLLGRQIMVRGTAEQVTQVKLILTQMGEDGTGIRRGEGELIRSFPLSGRDPQELLPILQRLWDRNRPTPIRVVTPEQRGPVREMITPSQRSGPVQEETVQEEPVQEETVQEETAQPGTSSTQQPSRPSAQRSALGTKVRDTYTVQVETESLPSDSAPSDEPLIQNAAPVEPENTPVPPAQPESLPIQVERPPGQVTPPAAGATKESLPGDFNQALDWFLAEPTPVPQPTTKPMPPVVSTDPTVTLTIMGDDILMAADDPAALDHLEELIETTMQLVPPSSSWTVFPLQSADATETATMLEQLIEGANVSSSSSSGLTGMMGSMQSFGSGVMDMTGVTKLGSSASGLKIVADIRLNALLVSGPSYKINEVQEWLRILDSSELPDSLRERVPRVIEVEYADVNDVYTNVKDLYKDYLEDGQAQSRAGANALAAMFGGGGNRGGSREQQSTPTVRMTISVDANTNSLLVSANEALFQEVQGFVTQLDTSAREANRMVRVVQLHNTSSTVVQQALGSLMPRVKVTSSSSRSSSSSSSSTPSPPPPSSGPPQGGPDQDQIRQMFEQRMRERMQQGGGGSPFGGGGPPGGGGSPFGGGGGGGGRGR